ncbi:aminoacyl-tRNA deacylase [Gemella sp. GH3]|uniref:aminoacyl-tRNA deacylase n=1 Tax=unclassified Gemella TaxID=2624949 RepID=UPI0015D06C70|nr:MULTISPECIES: aminoacyl-tRNA deacylase [unclassified Gemella]MBF0713604.1 aminoacyl-tRNA deacylase [Gemella sp. GH3.1]NYS50556.1 aminoacyl-tRNA deacylase [Gemella sp. GH3]
MAKKKEIKTNAMRLLDDNSINYNHYSFAADSEAARTGVGVADIIGKNHNQVFKTILTTDGKGNNFVAVVMSEDSIDFKKLAKEAGVKSLSMLPLKDLTVTTGYEKGGCSPFAMKKTFPTFVDIKSQDVETIIISAGKVGHQIEVKPKVLEELISAKVVDITK